MQHIAATVHRQYRVVQKKQAPFRFWTALAKPLTLTTKTFWIMAAVRLETSKKFCWILEHRILCVKKCWQPGSFKAVQEDFQANFEMDKSPAKSLIQRWINNFDAHRTVGDLHTASRDRETHSGRPRKHSACVIGAVHDSVVQSPKTLLTEMLPVIQFEQVYASESAPR